MSRRSADRPYNKASGIFPASLLVVSNLFLFGPFSIYYGNSSEFRVAYLDLLVIHSVPALVSLSFCLALGLALGQRGRPIYTALLFAVGTLTWAQASFLYWNYGALDGSFIDWNRFLWQPCLDTSIWVVVLLIALARPRFVARLAPVGSWLLLASQFMLLTGQSISSDEGHFTKTQEAVGSPPAALFQLSSERNVLHVILDGFQSDVFLELIEEEDLQHHFEGFTLFWENMAVAPLTAFAIPAILNGEIYDGREPFTTYFDRSVRQGFPNRLWDEGYRINLVPSVPMQETRHSVYFPTPAAFSASPRELQLREALYLLDLAAFRQSPHLLRRRIYAQNNWWFSRLISATPNETSFHHKAFLRDYVRRLEVADSTPAYHFLHLWPPHPPFVTNDDGSFAERPLPMTRVHLKNEARYILRIFVELIRRLKDLGVYDSALIVLQGDHGSSLPPVIDGTERDGLPSRMPTLLVVKPPGSQGPLRISKAPTTVADVPATIMGSLGIESQSAGESVFEISTTKARQRFLVTYRGGDAPPTIERRSISSGSIYESNSWDTAEILPVARAETGEYAWGEPVCFGVSGNADSFKGSGWSTPLGGYEWTNGHRATLNFSLESNQQDLVLHATFTPFLFAGEVDQQRVLVWANGVKIHDWVAIEQGLQSYQASIPQALLDSKSLSVTFEFPDATVPRSIGAGADLRMLAIAMHSVVIEQAQPK